MSRGARAGVDRDLDRVGAVVGGDAGADPAGGLDRDREGGLQRRLVLGRHQVEAEPLAALGGQRQADQPARLLGHEVDRLRGGELRRHHQVALVLAVLAVADDDHAAAADLLDRLLDRRERALARRRPRPLSLCVSVIWLTPRSFPANGDTNRSTYFATMSHSTFSCRPGAASPRFVRSSVSGISETSTQSSPSAATVRLTPSRRDRAPARPRSAAAPGRAPTRRRRAKPSSSTETTSPTPSTCPWTMWPPSRSEAFIASSRLTRSPGSSAAERGHRRASGSSPRPRSRRASAAVAVRQTPSTATESPAAISGAERRSRSAAARRRRRPRPPRPCPTSSIRPVNTSPLLEPGRDQDVLADGLDPAVQRGLSRGLAGGEGALERRPPPAAPPVTP